MYTFKGLKVFRRIYRGKYSGFSKYLQRAFEYYMKKKKKKIKNCHAAEGEHGLRRILFTNSGLRESTWVVRVQVLRNTRVLMDFIFFFSQN